MRLANLVPLLILSAALGCTAGDKTTVVQQVNASPPVLTGIAPASGLAIGGTTITLSGSAIVSGATVSVGAAVVPTGDVTFVSSTELTVLTPAGTPGPATVTVTNPDGASGALVGGFTFVVPPTLSTINPGQGVSTGGTPFTLTGTGFVAGTTVTFAGVAVASPVVSGTTVIWGASPSLVAATLSTADVTVWNPDGTSATLVAGFTPLGGAPQVAFGQSGVVTTNPSSGTDYALAVTDDGTYAYIGGMGYNGVSWEWRIEKRNLSNGGLDPNFGSFGAITSDPTSGGDWLLAITNDGANLYAVGYNSTTGNDWHIEKRSLTTGALVTGFGTGGVLALAITSNTDDCFAVTHDGTNLYLGGRFWGGGSNYGWRIEKRTLATGALVAGFGTSGVVTSVTSFNSDIVRGLQHDGTYLYAVGDEYSTSDDRWRIEKRLLSTGALDTNFGSSGVATSNPTSNDDIPHALLLQGGDVYVVGEQNLGSGPSDSAIRIEKRSGATGALVTAFGTSGAVVSDPTTSDDAALAVVLGQGGAFYVGGAQNQAAAGWTEKLSLGTGGLVSSFGTSGRVTFAANFYGSVNGLAFTPSGVLLVGADGVSNGQWHLELRAP